jgi:predicted AlkP superfamily pyrophosphatase or phosphodiesterase
MEAPMSRSLDIFVFIDALGWRIQERHRDQFLAGELQTRQPLGTVFGYSCTCDPTIITGLLPPEHGHFSFFAYDPERSPFRWLRPLGWLPSGFTSRGRVRHLLSKGVGRLLGYTGYFQLYAMPFDKLPYFDYTEKRDLYQPGGINSGAETIFDELRRREVAFELSDWRRSEEENLASLHRAIDEEEIQFAYLYLAHMDGILHRDGTRSDAVTQKIKWYDAELRKVLARARGRYERVRLHVFSDHGMTDVHTELPLMDQVEALGLRFGEDYAAVFDSTMARFWFLNERARSPVMRLLENTPGGRLLTDDDLRELHVPTQEHRYGEVFFRLDPGVLLTPSHLGVKPLKGMHGYDPSDADSTAFFGSTEALSTPPRQLEDLHGLMMASLS